MLKSKDMDLEKAIKQLKDLIIDRESFIQNDSDHDDVFLKDKKAIETVLQALEKLKEECRQYREFIYVTGGKDIDDITVTQYMQNQQEGYLRGRKEEQEKAKQFIEENLIPKKKIEEVKSKYKEKYKKHKAVADKQFEEVGTRTCFDNELAIRDLGAIRACEELLEDKSYE